jgi:hypothetical protein
MEKSGSVRNSRNPLDERVRIESELLGWNRDRRFKNLLFRYKNCCFMAKAPLAADMLLPVSILMAQTLFWWQGGLSGEKLGLPLLLITFLGPSPRHRDDCSTAADVAELSSAGAFQSKWVGAREGDLLRLVAPVRRITAPGECAESAIKGVNQR